MPCGYDDSGLLLDADAQLHPPMSSSSELRVCSTMATSMPAMLVHTSMDAAMFIHGSHS